MGLLSVSVGIYFLSTQYGKMVSRIVAQRLSSCISVIDEKIIIDRERVLCLLMKKVLYI